MADEWHGPNALDQDELPSWDLVHAFVLLNRHRSYEAAASVANVDSTTLRRRIQKLEKTLGRKLLVNENGLWTSSPDVKGLLAAAHEMEAAALRFSSGQGDAGGLVRISILESLAERLCPVFVKLQEMQPNLQLSISTETRFVDLVKEKVDVALRLARPVRNGEGLRIRKIGVLETDVYAHPAYIGRHGASETQDVCHRILDINTSFFHQDHDFVLSDPDWELFGIKGEVIFSSHSFSVLARMCALGHGVAILPNIIAETFPELRRLNADSLGVPLELWMISRLDLRAKWQKAMAGLLREEMATWRKS